MICIFNLVLLTSIFAGQVSSTNQPGCLTWEVHAGYLNLTCRLENFVQPVTLIDNHEKAHISCTLKKAKHNIGCIPKKRRKHISFDSSLQTVTFTIKNKYSNYVDGIWKCQQGCNSYETEVSTTKGIIDSTEISLYGELINNDAERKVKLKCVSCRAPRRNHAEFLINGSSDTSIVYNKINGKCIHNNVDCEPHVCSCTGNEFIHTFPVTSSYSTDYTCDMIFNDNDKGSKFSKNTTLFFNGKKFLKEGSTKEPDKGLEEIVDKNSRSLQDKSNNRECKCKLPDCNSQISLTSKAMETVVIGVVVLVVVVGVVLVNCYTRCGTTHRSDDHETPSLTDSGISEGDQDSLDNISSQTTDSGIEMGGRNIFVQGSDSSTTPGFCEPCNAKDVKTSAMYICLRCDEYMCKSCKINHSVMKHFRDHSILEIASFPEKFRLIQKCPFHKKYNDEYFCGNHNRLCCRICYATTHLHCKKVRTIEDVSEGYKGLDELNSYKKFLQMADDACLKLQMNSEDNVKQIVSDTDKISANITKKESCCCHLSCKNPIHNERSIKCIHDPLQIQLESKMIGCLQILEKRIKAVLKKKEIILRIKRIFDWLSEIQSLRETELFLLVQMSKDHLNDIEADLNKINRESITMNLRLVDYKTDSKTYSQKIVLEEEQLPNNYLHDLLSQNQVTKQDTEN